MMEVHKIVPTSKGQMLGGVGGGEGRVHFRTPADRSPPPTPSTIINGCGEWKEHGKCPSWHLHSVRWTRIETPPSSVPHPPHPLHPPSLIYRLSGRVSAEMLYPSSCPAQILTSSDTSWREKFRSKHTECVLSFPLFPFSSLKCADEPRESMSLKRSAGRSRRRGLDVNRKKKK